MLSSLTGGGGMSGGSAGPATATNTVKNGFDSSGWAVSFGSGNAAATGSTEGGSGGQMGQYLPYVMAGVALLIVWRMTRKR